VPEVACEIVRWIDDDFPGWVEARLVDAHGAVWTFHDKEPLFSRDNLTASSSYPAAGTIRCQVVEEDDAHGLAVIETSSPDGVTAVDGLTSRFTVLSHRVAR